LNSLRHAPRQRLPETTAKLHPRVQAGRAAIMAQGLALGRARERKFLLPVTFNARRFYFEEISHDDSYLLRFGG